MKCYCREIAVLEGAKAIEYTAHMEVVRTDKLKWETEYECPYTKIRWIIEYPNSELHGGGPPRLTRLS